MLLNVLASHFVRIRTCSHNVRNVRTFTKNGFHPFIILFYYNLYVGRLFTSWWMEIQV